MTTPFELDVLEFDEFADDVMGVMKAILAQGIPVTIAKGFVKVACRGDSSSMTVYSMSIPSQHVSEAHCIISEYYHERPGTDRTTRGRGSEVFDSSSC